MTGFSDEFRKWWKSDTGVDPGLGLPVESDPSYPPKEMTDAFEAFQGGEASRLGKVMETIEDLKRQIEQLTRERDEARANLAFASRMWDSPITSDWFDGVRNEAAHQVARWGTEHDAGKAPADWFGLLEYLGGKALHAATLGDVEKALHHTISAGACLMNWHRHLMDGQGLLRPGIEPPTGDIG